MTRYEEAQKLLMLGEFKSDDSYFMINDYLRDLKASHAALLVAIQGRFNDCQDQECNQCKDVRVLVKTAKGLK